MPTISIKKRLLDKHLGNCLSYEQLDELCFQYGLEVDDVLSERDETTGEEDEVYKIELPANRYDLLCVEGLTRALRIFQQQLEPPIYRRMEISECKSPIQILVDSTTKNIREFVVGAVLRDFQFDADIYASFIDLQDKLHQNIGRKRTLASIGTHDLDTIKGPFRYCARVPREIIFCPLNQNKKYSATELMELYKDSHLREYLSIIRDKPMYPVICDANGIICSLPPVINSEHSKITMKTRNIFIEATGTDLKKLEIVLDTVVTMFGQYCSKPFIIEPVQIIHPNGSVDIYPKLDYRDHLVEVSSIVSQVGVSDIGVDQAMELLSKMSLSCEAIVSDEGIEDEKESEMFENSKEDSKEQMQSPLAYNSQEMIKVTIPPTRHDILHECDIAEDLALAFGYNAIPPALPQSNTVAEPLPLNKLSDQLRLQMAFSGWTEVLNFALCSTDDVGFKMRRQNERELDALVRIANPKTLDFQVVRNSLLPGILKTIANNKDMPLPLRLFEIQDVVHLDTSQDTKCRNERRLAAVFYSKSGSFEVLHGLLDRIMQMLDVPFAAEDGYCIRQSDDPSYFSGRCANILFLNKCIGTFGVLHPEVLANFSLTNPCSALEICIEPFLSF